MIILVNIFSETHYRVADVGDDEDVGHAAVALVVPTLGDVVAPVDAHVGDRAQLLQDHRPVARVVHEGFQVRHRFHHQQIFASVHAKVINEDGVIDARHAVISSDQ